MSLLILFYLFLFFCTKFSTYFLRVLLELLLTSFIKKLWNSKTNINIIKSLQYNFPNILCISQSNKKSAIYQLSESTLRFLL